MEVLYFDLNPQLISLNRNNTVAGMVQREKMARDEKNFWSIYAAAHNNASQLLSDAEMLLEHGRWASAYFLAFTALEEISKSQLAADVWTEYIEEEEFWDVYTSHRHKVGRMAWASKEARRYLDVETEQYIDVEEPQVKRRMSALYVECNRNRTEVESPSELITDEMAKSLVHIVRSAFHSIFVVTEYWGHQIGTKGFMK